MAQPMRVLTFNWHEAYLHLLSKTGYAFDVVQKRKAGLYGWIEAFRPIPPNVRLVHARTAQEKLRAGAYDRVIAHNFEDLLAVRDCGVPVVLVFHNKLTTEIALSRRPVDRQDYLARAKRLIRSVPDLRLVFVSPAKQIDWGLEGRVILPGIDPGDYSGYEGDEPRVLRVGNGLKDRDLMLGWSIQERILDGLPSTVAGLNPSLTGSILPESWDAFRSLLVHHRVFLNTTLPPYEDGYNLAMLEAMATGMPVVSIANPSSPIEDGVNGFVSEDEKRLRERILELLEDRERAAAIGRKARETVVERFPIGRFLAEWRDVLGQGSRTCRVALSAAGSVRAPAPRHKPRVLLTYTANPQTTGAYLERGLRSLCDVLTYGPAIGEEVLKKWDLEKIRGRLYEHDLPYNTAEIGQILEQLPADWKPDLFLWVESGVSYPLRGFTALSCPTACWLIDTHIHIKRHLEIAKSFDFVFLAQKKYVPLFQQAGIREAHWLPLACDPDIHREFGLEAIFDISFVGSLTAAHRRRNELLLQLSRRFSVHLERCFLEEMAYVFSRSRIVFNCSVLGDLNMRVFEALSTGSLLVTDEAAGSGLEDFFEDGRHLVTYRSPEELEARVAYFLGHEEERARIAREGMREARARHTYAHRAAAILERVGLLEHSLGITDAVRDRYRLGCGRHDDRIAQAVAEIYAREGRPEAAFPHFSEALTLNPENAEALKGMLSTASGEANRADAIRRLETYLALHPADLELTLRHAELCLQAGRIEDSLRSVDRILLFEPTHQQAQHVRNLLRPPAMSSGCERQETSFGQKPIPDQEKFRLPEAGHNRSNQPEDWRLIQENVRINDLEMAQSREICTSWPKTLVLNLSAECNLMCRFCGQTQFHKDFAHGERLNPITVEKLKRIFFDVEIGYPLHVDLQGDGEPLLQPDFREIFLFCRKTFPYSSIRICTNGTPLTRSMSDFLVGGKLNWLNVLLNAGSAEVHEKVCGAKAFHRIVDNIRYLQDRKRAFRTNLPELGMSYVLTRYNLGDVENFLRLCAGLGIKYATIQYMTVVNREALFDSVVYEKKHTNQVLLQAHALAEELGLMVNLPTPFHSTGLCEENPPPVNDFDFRTRYQLRARAKAAGLKLLRTPQAHTNPQGRRVLEKRLRIQRPPAFRCGYPWDFISLHGDGRAQLCCGAIGFEEADTMKDGFWKVWNGPIRRYLRRTVNSSQVDAVCDKCPLNRVRDVDNIETHRQASI